LRGFQADRDWNALKDFANLTLCPVDRDNCLTNAADVRRLSAVFTEAVDMFKAYGKRMPAALFNSPPGPGRIPSGQVRLNTA